MKQPSLKNDTTCKNISLNFARNNTRYFKCCRKTNRRVKMAPTKPFNQMNYDEKKERIKVLWSKARAVYIMRSFTIRLH